MKRIFITGATGFLGRHLCHAASAQHHEIMAAVRSRASWAWPLPFVRPIEVPALGSPTQFPTSLLDGVDTVIHMAARVHAMRESAADPLAEFRRVNVEGTRQLALAAAGRVQRFVFISSVHAMCRTADRVLNETSPCQPDSPYGRSKWEAEQVLWEVSQRTGLQVVVLRPAPVYGPAGKGNLMRLFRFVERGWPLPLGNLYAQRSFVYVGNLVDAIWSCVTHPNATGQTFLVSDGVDVSTTDLLRRFARSLQQPARLWAPPRGMMRLVGRALGQANAVERLLGALAVDSRRIRETLDWQPPFTLDDGLAATAAWIVEQSSASRRKAA